MNQIKIDWKEMNERKLIKKKLIKGKSDGRLQGLIFFAASGIKYILVKGCCKKVYKLIH